MSPDPARELLDLVAINAFYTRLLEERLRHRIPVPREIAEAGMPARAAQSAATLKQWLDLLDMAISPPMVRDALKDASARETAEALLRYFVAKRPKDIADHEKTDFIATFLYRCFSPGPPPPPEIYKPQPDDTGSEPKQRKPFENEIYRILGEMELPTLTEEHSQLLREFHFITQEVDDFRHFDQLMDSGVMQRVREIKQAFGDSFYHPRVRAILAEYNVFFGARFDDLFRHAAKQIKNFVAKVQEEGGSIMARVDGDVTVQQLAEVEENEILRTEYGRAQEAFRKISKMKKAVDIRGSARPAASAPPVARPAAVPTRRPAVAPAAAPPSARSVGSETVIIKNLLEESKLKGVEDSLCEFVRAAAPDWNHVVPVRRGEITLSASEIEAFRADYGDEKSFRADYAAALRLIIALQARLMEELEDYRTKRKSAHLWQPHADTLAYLLEATRRTIGTCGPVLATAHQRGLKDKATALDASLQKLRTQSELVTKTLENKG